MTNTSTHNGKWTRNDAGDHICRDCGTLREVWLTPTFCPGAPQ